MLNYSGYFANAGDWQGFDQLPDPHPLRLKLPYSLSYLNQAFKKYSPVSLTAYTNKMTYQPVRQSAFDQLNLINC